MGMLGGPSSSGRVHFCQRGDLAFRDPMQHTSSESELQTTAMRQSGSTRQKKRRRGVCPAGSVRMPGMQHAPHSCSSPASRSSTEKKGKIRGSSSERSCTSSRKRLLNGHTHESSAVGSTSLGRVSGVIGCSSPVALSLVSWPLGEPQKMARPSELQQALQGLPAAASASSANGAHSIRRRPAVSSMRSRAGLVGLHCSTAKHALTSAAGAHTRRWKRRGRGGATLSFGIGCGRAPAIRVANL